MDNDDEIADAWYGALIWVAGFLGLLHMSVTPHDDPAWVAMGWVSVGLIVICAAGYMVFTRFWRRWAFWRLPLGSRRTVAGQLAELAIVVPVLGAVFVGLNTMLVVHDGIAMEGDLGSRSLVLVSLAHFGLVLADSIPVLDVVGSFELSTPASFHGFAHGVLVTTFRVLLLAPVVGLLSSMLERHRERQTNVSTSTESTVA